MIRPRKLFLTTSIALCLTALAATGATAAPPTIVSTGFSKVSTDSARLEAEINPNGQATFYRFEYGPQDCSLNPCASTPELEIPAQSTGSGDLTEGSNAVTNVVVSEGAFSVGASIAGTGIPASTTITAIDTGAKTLALSQPATASATGVALTVSGAQPVSAQVEGLEPGTKYFFRAVAKNSDAPSGVNGPVRTFKTFGLPAPPSLCPNDSLRTIENPMAAFIEYLGQNLPDCRAYEQASPVDKNGLDVKGLPVWVKASPAGDAVTFMPTAGIPGGEGAQELTPMLSRRGA
ncbi:MAG TPA: fibronectin type III domain-containing protein, partial [Pyrinomonadaceae bacterium]|nr:fibronectin type III domain-containing protein [Pyrinomonadaceae bacterium]